ncbi:protein indeterminate-domain 16 [Amborella trichopoda]|uniref:C2H2-type domain-containing protein n=1 Tax=Amborella trichopoda TaxID=13333 RepID=W1PUR9_AMBTC|nr:protein indeterminate-domain 16 [Amborella trichopoda]ERN11050.1 hypothetical protein AMTR_s00024p00098860 [Amborella trichopoda]|eukprot:XP_006849469.1 protein indeterminate-domain 16 [Amborella trichopoda]
MFGPPSPGSTPSLGNCSTSIEHGIIASPFPPISSSFPSCLDNGGSKRKRRPAGTPDPDAEVVSLSPRTLLESDRYVCEICNQGFQRDQNLQMHRRRHKVPWKLLKRDNSEVKKRVFVCPEPSCLHHDPCHALGDLVGIKKHFRRKHSNHKQWTCDKCSKGYAVQSDYKAHLKTCGTRGHSCDCGRVFSRVESFIEHQDTCNAGRERQDFQTTQQVSLSRTVSSPCNSSERNMGSWATLKMLGLSPSFQLPNDYHHNLELQLLPSPNNQIQRTPQRNQDQKAASAPTTNSNPNFIESEATRLQLSIGNTGNFTSIRNSSDCESTQFAGNTISDRNSSDFLRLAMEERRQAEQARQEAKREMELAEREFANAKRIRQQAQAELDKAQILKDQATKHINSTILQITCQACKNHFQISDENSLAMSYMSSVVTEGEGENDNRQQGKIPSI